jgi:hypothetical protein
MGQLTRPHRPAYVHIGTHKTGTTSIQALLASNASEFLRAGVYVPLAGRIERASAGHHNVAWELAHDPKFDERLGSFAALLREAEDANAPALCLSSEDFELLHADRGALRTLRDGLAGIGYEPKIILFLRPQADYFESLYAELVKGWNLGFPDVLEAVISQGSFGASLFDYERLAASFAEVFGRERTILRTYRSSIERPEALLREFMAIVAPGNLDFDRLVVPPRLNPMTFFPDVVAARERHLGCKAHHVMAANQAFDPLGLRDITRMIFRFSASNDHVARSYGIRIGCVSPEMLAREIITELFRDRASHFRKQLIRALIEETVEIAA